MTLYMFQEAAACKKKLYFLILIFFFTGSLSAFCQGNDLDLNQNINLPSTSIRLDSLLKITSRQTNTVFSFNAGALNQSVILNFGSTNTLLSNILTALKSQIGLEYTLIENHIIIKEPKTKLPLKHKPLATKSSRVEKTEVINPGVKQKKKAGISNHSVIPKTTKPKLVKSRKEVLINSLNPIPAPILASFSLLYLKIPEVFKMDSLLKKNDNDSLLIATGQVPEEMSTTTKDKIKPPFFVQAGICTDEILYAGTAVQVGIPSIFATFSLNTNFSISQLRYGIGSSFEIKKTKLILFANFGQFKNNFSANEVANIGDSTSSGDSTLVIITTDIPIQISVKSQLFRIGILTEFKISSKLKLQAGLQYNSINNAYSVDGSSSNLGSIEGNGDQSYYTVNPPYTLTNTYSSTSSTNRKSWVGFQINLFYTLNFKQR